MTTLDALNWLLAHKNWTLSCYDGAAGVKPEFVLALTEGNYIYTSSKDTGLAFIDLVMQAKELYEKTQSRHQ